MTPEANISRSGEDDFLPEFGDDTSRIVYPPVEEGETDDQYVSRSMTSWRRYRWLFWLIVASVAFGLFVGIMVLAVDEATANVEAILVDESPGD